MKHHGNNSLSMKNGNRWRHGMWRISGGNKTAIEKQTIKPSGAAWHHRMKIRKSNGSRKSGVMAAASSSSIWRQWQAYAWQRVASIMAS